MVTRTTVVLLLAAAFGGLALADCPPDCVPGGGPTATDCFVAYDGIAAATTSCVDGTACDTDGKANGVCRLGLRACINVAGLADCTASTLSGAPTVKPTTTPAARALAGALTALDPNASGCTPPGFTLPLKVSAAGIKKSVARLSISAVSGGKKDKDKLKLTCEPSPTAPTLSGDVQPILTAKCAIPACHSGPSPSNMQSLEPGQSYGSDVNVHAVNNTKLIRVVPGNVKKSYFAKKILGPTDRTSLMPQGCPGLPPGCKPDDPTFDCCLTDDEIATILYWIANGAPDN